MQIIQRLAGGKSEEHDLAEAGYSIHRLSEALPHFLTIETRAEQGQVARINRNLDPKGLRDTLVSISSIL